VFYHQTVARAARALDAHHSDGERWVLGVDVARLDVSSYRDCVLAQLYGNHLSDASWRFRRNLPDDVLLAFGDGNLPAPRWTLLTWAWRREITRRRRALERANARPNVVARSATTDRREWIG